jgi:hypothetical protein
MKRVRRIIFNGLTVLSLLLCLATVGLWVRSYWTPDVLVRHHKWETHSHGYPEIVSTLMTLSSNHGRLIAGKIYGHFIYWLTFTGIQHWEWTHDTTVPQGLEDSELPLLGFLSRHPDPQRYYYGNPYDLQAISTPHSLPVLLLAVLPLIRLVRHLSRSRVLPGHCLRCGYDLRATPDRCPEYGIVAPATTQRHRA